MSKSEGQQTKEVKTDNSYIGEKISLRLDCIKTIKEQSINVLDCYHGQGVIWSEISKLTEKRINVIGIDEKKNSKADLIGNNIKFLTNIDLGMYNIIDLDAYGCPDEQLRILKQKKYKVCIVVTYILTHHGQMPKSSVVAAGYTNDMYKQSPVFLSSLVSDIYERTISKNNIIIRGYFLGRKKYFWFREGE